MKAQWVIICGLIFALLTAAAAGINTESVNLHYYWGEVQISLIVVISASILVGGVIVALFGTMRPYLLRREKDKLLHKNQELEQSNHKLQEKLSEVESAYSLLIKQKTQEPELQKDIPADNHSQKDSTQTNQADYPSAAGADPRHA